MGSVDVDAVLPDVPTSSSCSNDRDGEMVAVEGCEVVLRLKILNIPVLVNADGAGSPLLSTCSQVKVYHQHTHCTKSSNESN